MKANAKGIKIQPYTDAYVSEWIAFEPRCRRILDGNFHDQEYLSSIAHTKRFLERFVGDETFRAELRKDARATAQRYGLKADPEEIRLLWDHKYAKEYVKRNGRNAPLTVQRHRSFVREKLIHRERLQMEECIPIQKAHRIWRERQINRSCTELGEERTRGSIHAPLMFELSKGCSVGCWFCAFRANKKEADFLYTPKNRRLWREVLFEARERIGYAAGTGVCYWATDPMDNPDYEKFCIDYARILGRFPQTTTAQPHKHMERTKKLLKLSKSMGGVIDRFSILSLDILNQVHEAFTPEELLYTELITQNIESNRLLSSAGRARGSKLLKARAERLNIKDAVEAPGTIACLSGFLVNMLDRSVKLVTPCGATDEWPDGFWILEEGYFETAAKFGELIQGMIDRNMPITLRVNDPVAFRPDLSYSPIEEGFILQSRYVASKITRFPAIETVGSLIHQGNKTAGEIVLEVEELTGVDPTQTFHTLNSLFQQGFLNENPNFFLKKGK